MIRRVAEDRRLKDLPDHELPHAFLSGHDQVAFGALLRRHGSMVLHVCQNIVGNEQDAEDAFQATFLIFAKKSGSIRKTASIGSWLHGVAYRTALKARALRTTRQVHEARTPTVTAAPDDFSWREVQQLVHAELNRVAERYRAPLVHCYLEGKTQDEAAALLGVSKATVRKRLERGRALLRARLVRRGLGPAAILAASAWPAATSAASVPVALLDSTVKAASLIGVGPAVTADMVSPSVIALTEGVLKAMFVAKIKLISAVVLAALVTASAVGLSYQARAQPAAGPQRVVRPQDSSAEARPLVSANRSTADDLDALRLEIEALRKEVRATRERVKVLEAEVRSSKREGGKQALNDPLPSSPIITGQMMPLNNLETPTLSNIQNLPAGYVDPNNFPPGNVIPSDSEALPRAERPYDPFAVAEAALAKLRQNPHDKQAAASLDKATRRLKARTEVKGRTPAP
jgi:RNA polymerase sigma factor (sigma-70 family)